MTKSVGNLILNSKSVDFGLRETEIQIWMLPFISSGTLVTFLVTLSLIYGHLLDGN